jgi:hypothetical protein
MIRTIMERISIRESTKNRMLKKKKNLPRDLLEDISVHNAVKDLQNSTGREIR